MSALSKTGITYLWNDQLFVSFSPQIITKLCSFIMCFTGALSVSCCFFVLFLNHESLSVDFILTRPVFVINLFCFYSILMRLEGVLYSNNYCFGWYNYVSDYVVQITGCCISLGGKSLSPFAFILPGSKNYYITR